MYCHCEIYYLETWSIFLKHPIFRHRCPAIIHVNMRLNEMRFSLKSSRNKPTLQEMYHSSSLAGAAAYPRKTNIFRSNGNLIWHCCSLKCSYIYPLFQSRSYCKLFLNAGKTNPTAPSKEGNMDIVSGSIRSNCGGFP